MRIMVYSLLWVMQDLYHSSTVAPSIPRAHSHLAFRGLVGRLRVLSRAGLTA